jgi:hypothetical protein
VPLSRHRIVDLIARHVDAESGNHLLVLSALIVDNKHIDSFVHSFRLHSNAAVLIVVSDNARIDCQLDFESLLVFRVPLTNDNDNQVIGWQHWVDRGEHRLDAVVANLVRRRIQCGRVFAIGLDQYLAALVGVNALGVRFDQVLLIGRELVAEGLLWVQHDPFDSPTASGEADRGPSRQLATQVDALLADVNGQDQPPPHLVVMPDGTESRRLPRARDAGRDSHGQRRARAGRCVVAVLSVRDARRSAAALQLHDARSIVWRHLGRLQAARTGNVCARRRRADRSATWTTAQIASPRRAVLRDVALAALVRWCRRPQLVRRNVSLAICTLTFTFIVWPSTFYRSTSNRQP